MQSAITKRAHDIMRGDGPEAAVRRARDLGLQLLKWQSRRYRISLAALLLGCELTALADPVTLVLRYDDYSSTSHRETDRAVFGLARALGTSVLTGVIPVATGTYPIIDSEAQSQSTDLDAGKRALLRQGLASNSIEVAAHGFHHRSNAALGMPKSEFAGLDGEVQSRVVVASRVALQRDTGAKVRTFIPPWNRLDSSTLSALESAGYQVVSASLETTEASPRSKLMFLPQSTETPYLTKAIESIEAAGIKGAMVVVNMHPYDFEGDPRPDATYRPAGPRVSAERLQASLLAMKSSGRIRLVSLSDLVESREDLSAERVASNYRLRNNLIIRHSLLPQSLGPRHVEGNFYGRAEAESIYVRQLMLCLVLYAALVCVGAAISMFIFKYLVCRPPIKRALVAVSAIALCAVVWRGVWFGFYLMSAVSVALFAGGALGAHLSRSSGDSAGRIGNLPPTAA